MAHLVTREVLDVVANLRDVAIDEPMIIASQCSLRRCRDERALESQMVNVEHRD
jgi:predicted nuclease with RNAse H fold